MHSNWYPLCATQVPHNQGEMLVAEAETLHPIVPSENVHFEEAEACGHWRLREVLQRGLR